MHQPLQRRPRDIDLIPTETHCSDHDIRPFNWSEHSTERDRGVIACPHYTDLHSRLDSFVNWRKPNVNTESLAEAGFFFEGISDQTRCYSCNLGVRHWKPQDDPYEVHARLSDTCHHLRNQKGEAWLQLKRKEKCPYNAAVGVEFPSVKLRIERRSLETKADEDNTDALEAENKRLKSFLLCRNCKRKESTWLLQNCGHVAFCDGCKPLTKRLYCPICDRRVRETIRIYR